jgi:gluconate 5-dehydrogenase
MDGTAAHLIRAAEEIIIMEFELTDTHTQPRIVLVDKKIEFSAISRGRPSMFDLTGKTALVTGGSRGLGLEIAKGLGLAGASVVVSGRSDHALARAIQKLRSFGVAASPINFDITDPAAIVDSTARIVECYGGVDILVNNASQRDRRALFELSLADVRNLLEVDLIGPFELSREVGKVMIEARGGRIINITSIAGQIARAGDASYTTAKGGLESLTKALAAEFGQHGITVNAVAPGFFATEANAAMVAQEAVATWLEQRTSLGRWGVPAEIAGAIVFLASPAASYITGQVLAVDGGYLSHF